MLKAFNELLFPMNNICLMCKERNTEVKDFICKTCYNNLEIVDRNISIDSPYIKDMYYSLVYNRFIRDIIRSYKYNGKNYLYRPLGQIILNTYCKMNIQIDKVAFVPMHRRKEALRGYNQAELLAKYISKKMDKPLIKDLIKIKSTKEQSNLNKVERIENLRNSFKIKNNKSINGLRILLVDDIITTGGTMDECSRVLKEAGAKEIIGLAITSSKKIKDVREVNVRNCRSCGKIYQYDGFNVCHSCRKDAIEDFKKVKEYIYEYPGANISEVHEGTEVGVDKIIEFLKEGRLEIAEGGNLILECENCGVSITTGRFCDKCTSQLQRELGGVVDSARNQNKETSRNEAKFRYINKYRDKK